MTNEELMQQALEALEVATTPLAKDRQEVLRAQAALRESLAQPNDFNPDWDAMAVMVEEQQRMAKRIAELEAQPEQEPLAWFRYETVYEYRNQLARCTKDCIGAFPVYTTPPQRKPPQFPTMLRKMWSGAEVQKWINENWNAAHGIKGEA